MTTDTGNAAEEQAIRAIMADAADAIRAKDVDRCFAAWASDVRSFDVIDPLRFTGLETVKERLAAWFSGFDGPVGYETRDLTITAGAEVAFCHALNHVSATRTDGSPLDMWWRATTCFRKVDGAWTITHAHSSVPMNIESGQASVGLKP